MSKLYIDTQINQLANASAYGIMVDESTRGEIKNFIMCYQFWNQSCQAPTAVMTHLQNILRCNADTISVTVVKYIERDGLDIAKCILWVTDNTAYMSGEKKYLEGDKNNEITNDFGLHLKIHANMSELMKESKLRLASSKISKENLTDGLNEIRKQRNKAKRHPLQEAQPQLFG
ncbi:18943_t:CDS:2, partial [Gigaspora margarita]